MLLLLVAAMVSCKSFDRDASRFQQTLIKQQELALTTTYSIAEALINQRFDSLHVYASQTPAIAYYVFSRTGMVYWSNNWLAADDVWMTGYNRWAVQRFSNAVAVSRWTKAGEWNILTVIPLKYDYPFENEQLKNEFIPPFLLDKNVEIRQSRASGSYQITDADGNYLLAIRPIVADSMANDTYDPLEQTTLAESFSYPGMMTKGTEIYHITERGETLADMAATYKTSERKLRKMNKFDSDREPRTGEKILVPSAHETAYVYIIIAIVFISLLFVLGTYVIIANKGFSNLNLGVKFQYLIALMLLISFVYVFFASTAYVRDHYSERQQKELTEKTRYIQAQLRDMYYDKLELNSSYTSSLNVILRDMRYVYGTDIHVYDLRGKEIGSSLPELFDYGVISRRIASDPFFTRPLSVQDSVYLTRHDYAGHPYLTAHAQLYNMGGLGIGYVEVPYFVSGKERHMAIDEFLSRLFPPYLLVMVVSMFLGWFLARHLTYPLQTLAEGMKRFKVGEHNAHLDYLHDDEVGQLVAQFNQMMDELEESTAKLARVERETAWQTMARQVAHEINNTLTPMQLNLQKLQRQKANDDPRFEESFDRCSKMLLGEIGDLARFASSFSTFAKLPAVVTTLTDVAEKLSCSITLFRENQHNVPVRYVGPDNGVLAKADTEQISLVFNNLIKNALQAIGDKPDGDIIVVLREEERTVEISVSDNGCGIPETAQSKIFIPNFTTKTTGSGLGLAISKNIVEGSDGRIWFSTSDKGTTFYVSLRK